ncbi:septum site-determining protein MinC [Variovorax sp. HJSM1_2]|uniref:septum site-determining protein MinC n=1 Tax=Variovorax sp. HJSM1_2 TaxID=3366263 RepID=UPI003BE35956
MSAVPAGSSRASFDLKSATLPLIAVLLKTADLKALAAALAERFGDTPDFFDQDPVLVNLAQLPEDAGAIDFKALNKLLRQYRMQPVAVHGGSEAQRAAAVAAGLVEAPDVAQAPAQQVAAEPVAALPVAAPEPVAEVKPVAAAAAVPTLVIDKPLRSGQQVYARGADLVVLAAVNAGAEVLADGNIHVYGPLRGRAIAGVRGNASARIFSTCLEAELISIAGTYRTSEVPLPADVLGKPAQVRMVDDKLLMEPL